MSDIAQIVQTINRFLAAMNAADTPPHVLDELLQSCLACEFVLRRLFATNRFSSLLSSPYIGIFDILDLPPTTLASRPRNWADQQSDFVWRYRGVDHRFPQKYILPLEPRLRRPPGAPCVVDGLEDFLKNWEAFTGGALSGIKNWKNLLAGGGAVLASLTRSLSKTSRQKLFEIYQSPEYKGSDIDLFLWGLTEEQAKRRMEEIFYEIRSSSMCGAICFRTKNTITIQTEFPRRPVQIILRLYKSPAEILAGFDVDSCCVGFNGTNVFTNPRGLAAIVRQCNTIDLSRRSPSYEHRLAKYASRGYEIFYPALERNKIDYCWLADPDRNVFPAGLGRLIVYEIMSSDYRSLPRQYEDLAQHIDPATHSSETLRPSDYDYGWCKIPYGPKWWHPKKVLEHVRKSSHAVVTAISNNFVGDRPMHFHVVTFGTMRKCLNRCCDQMLFKTREPQTQEGLPSAVFRGPVRFITDDPGRQLVGSFNPINFGDWESQAYLEDEGSDTANEDGYDADRDGW